MFSNALFAAAVTLLALALFLLDACRFLIPYRALLWYAYRDTILFFALTLFVNLTAAFYSIGRRLFLKDTGQKLAHIEKQLRSGDSISEELSRRLNE
jgi:hypothetical protein